MEMLVLPGSYARHQYTTRNDVKYCKEHVLWSLRLRTPCEVVTFYLSEKTKHMVMTECINTNTFNRNFVTAAGTTKDEQQATSSTAENTHKSALISISYKTEGTFHMVREENWVSLYSSTFVHPAPQVKKLKQPLEQNWTESWVNADKVKGTFIM